jgi:hypothetical protein
MEAVLQDLAACALKKNQSLTVTDLSGAHITYPGVYGLDPAWASGPPTLSLSGTVGQCLMTHYGATFDSSQIVANFKLVMQYLVSCALPSSATVSYTDFNGSTQYWSGALGLAPEWQTGAPTQTSQQLVSACLAARTNAAGKHVQLSLRGGPLTKASGNVTQIEAYHYTRYEGAFIANLFSATPYVKTCTVDGGDMAGRLCTQGTSCGFQQLGTCTTACTTTDADGNYTNCASSTNVLSTYLPFESRVAAGANIGTGMRLHDGTVWMWGSQVSGELGNGINNQNLACTPQQVMISAGVPLTNAAGIYSGGESG